MRFRIGALAAFSAFSICSGAQALELPGPVVDTAWLAKNQNEVQVVDVRADARSFTAQPVFEADKKTGKKMLTGMGGHIPGAVLVPFGAIRAERMEGGRKVSFMLPEKAAFEKVLQGAGVSGSKPLVLVSTARSPLEVDEALRLYWQLKYFGDDRVAVLNGGMAAWLAEGREVAVTPAPTAAGDWKASAERKDLVATSDDVAGAEAGGVQLVDARNAAQYYGMAKQDYVSAFGHIKGAHLVPTEVLFKKDGPAFKFYAPDTYRALYAMDGVRSDAPTISYCNSGHAASGPWFIQHEILGNARVRLFDGSMHKWALERRPLESVNAAPMGATCAPGSKAPGC